MKLLKPVAALLLCFALSGCTSEEKRWKEIEGCLPQDLKLSSPTMSIDKKRTVKDALKAVGAHPQNGKLIDSNGREIRFFHRTIGSYVDEKSDWYKQQEQKLRELQAEDRYTVIVITMVMI